MRPGLVLVSGSREWPQDAIGEIGERLLPIAQRDNRIILLHGGAKRGVDQLADSLWRTWGMVDPWVQEAPWGGPCTDRIDPLTGRPFCQPGHRKRRRRHSGGQAGSGDYCPRMGHRRNGYMVWLAVQAPVDAVAEVFIRDSSPGATDCAKRCEHAGLPFTVTEYRGTTRSG